MLKSCVHKGGSGCRRQGGDGCLFHKTGYTHNVPRGLELEEPLSYDTPIMGKSGDNYTVLGLDSSFDEDFNEALLSLSLDETVFARDLVRKSMYDFDVETEEGINKLLALLPILDPDIIREVYAEIWPGYPPDDVDPRRARLEIKGYLMDYLSGGILESQETEETAPAPGGPPGGETQGPGANGQGEGEQGSGSSNQGSGRADDLEAANEGAEPAQNGASANEPGTE